MAVALPGAGKESDFQEVVVDLAATCGWLVHHTRPSLDRRGQWRTHIQGDKGFPDLALAHASGRFILAELKGAAGRLSPEQVEWIRRLSLAGVEVHVWRPADMPEIRSVLQRET